MNKPVDSMDMHLAQFRGGCHQVGTMQWAAAAQLGRMLGREAVEVAATRFGMPAAPLYALVEIGEAVDRLVAEGASEYQAIAQLAANGDIATVSSHLSIVLQETDHAA